MHSNYIVSMDTGRNKKEKAMIISTKNPDGTITVLSTFYGDDVAVVYNMLTTMCESPWLVQIIVEE